MTLMLCSYLHAACREELKTVVQKELILNTAKAGGCQPGRPGSTEALSYRNLMKYSECMRQGRSRIAWRSRTVCLQGSVVYSLSITDCNSC